MVPLRLASLSLDSAWLQPRPTRSVWPFPLLASPSWPLLRQEACRPLQMRKEAMSAEDLHKEGAERTASIVGSSSKARWCPPNDWILLPGPQTWDSQPHGPQGDGTPLPEHPAKVGTPQPATMTSHLVFAGMAAILTLVVGVFSSATKKRILSPLSPLQGWA